MNTRTLDPIVAIATAPALARMINPKAITRSTPKRAMMWPVTKLGAYIASTWADTTSAAWLLS